ncbi:arginyl-tRNA--protein transferase 1 isoform X5 [Protopterus annectens]|uniref:arginyl-tRNA--protein transferase 1 isoform X5 n=1 Tax=Protopterus annectens TaxID=7888 RepID=UPI001CFB694D|nr:arginyl-tRNA--protein transferase 1 isoform X5 [Protopterus annectens]
MASGKSLSIVQYFEGAESHKCGYCKNTVGSVSNGMWAHVLTVEDYQDLIDRGWRRSGMYVYKPIMHKTCCPQYTIRCRALNFQPSKSQKKKMKMLTRFLTKGEVSKEPGDDEAMESCFEIMGGQPSPELNKCKATEHDLTISGDDLDVEVPVQEIEKKKEEKESVDKGESSAYEPSDTTKLSTAGRATPTPHRTPKPGEGPDTNRPPCRKAKEVRRERKLQKTQHKAGVTVCPEAQSDAKSVLSEKSKANQPKSLEEFLSYPAGELKHRLEFQRFLCNSPLQEEYPPDGPDCGYGSFHQQYWLDGKLLAVGVIDILPYCVSSVYFYYDPDYSFLSLGVYSALREIAFTRELHEKAANLSYYYMGFFIYSCPKMRYKGQYKPSDLLCPETYAWIPIEQCRPKLEHSKYSRLNSDQNTVDENAVSDINNVHVLYKNRAMLYSMYTYRRLAFRDSDEDELVKEYAGLVGKTCAQKMLLYMR